MDSEKNRYILLAVIGCPKAGETAQNFNHLFVPILGYSCKEDKTNGAIKDKLLLLLLLGTTIRRCIDQSCNPRLSTPEILNFCFQISL